MSGYHNPHEHDRQHVSTEEDFRKYADNVAEWHPLASRPYEERLKLARNFGPNWASVLSGCGDQ